MKIMIIHISANTSGHKILYCNTIRRVPKIILWDKKTTCEGTAADLPTGRRLVDEENECIMREEQEMQKLKQYLRNIGCKK